MEELSFVDAALAFMDNTEDKALPFKRGHSLEIPDDVEPIDVLDNCLDFDQDVTMGEMITSLSPQVPAPVEAEAPTVERRPKQRTSRKEQIDELRQTVSELSRGLESLRAWEASPNFRAQSQTLWKRVAVRQLLLLSEAEKENAALKALVAIERRSSRNTRRMFRRRIDNEMMDNPRDVKLQKRSDQKVFDELSLGIDEIYANLDKVYASKGMAEVPCPGRKRLVYRDAADGDTFVEILDKNLVPFDFKQTKNAVWKFLQGRRIQDGRRHICSEEFNGAGNTSRCCITFTCAGKGLASHVTEQRLTQRYDEEDRTVFISRIIVEPMTGESRAAGMKFRETMIFIVKAGEPLASGQETAVIENLVSTAKYVDASESAVQGRWSSLVATAVDGWATKVSFSRQQIENFLFDFANGSN